MRSTARALLAVGLSIVVAGCSGPRRAAPEGGAPPAKAAAAEPPPRGVELAKGYVVGEGVPIGNLTVFPVLAREQPDLGPFTTLAAAIARGEAEVREVGERAQVNALTVENKGETPIFILAGTVLEGGKQDRQVGQDVVVGGKQAVDVEAFCVERGRWTANREGRQTGGKFGAAKALADSNVRAAGQYEKDQSQVWSEVSKVNVAHRKESASSALAASLDDGEVRAERERLAGSIGAAFERLRPTRDAVGLAYAVDGRVRGVRWFVNHGLFELFRGALAEGAAGEAITARRAAAGAPETSPPRAATAADVRAFLAEVDAAPVAEERATAGENVNTYRESGSGFGSKVKFAPKAAARGPAGPGAAAPTPAATEVTLSADFVRKGEGAARSSAEAPPPPRPRAPSKHYQERRQNDPLVY